MTSPEASVFIGRFIRKPNLVKDGDSSLLIPKPPLLKLLHPPIISLVYPIGRAV
jgi:hypothetical protein